MSRVYRCWTTRGLLYGPPANNFSVYNVALTAGRLEMLINQKADIYDYTALVKDTFDEDQYTTLEHNLNDVNHVA